MTEIALKFNIIIWACPFASLGSGCCGFHFISAILCFLFSKVSKGSATSCPPHPSRILTKLPLLAIALYAPLKAQNLKSKPFPLTQEMNNLILADIQKIQEGWLNNDFTIAIKEDLLHPKIVDIAGGKQTLIENTLLEMQALGNFQVQNVVFENPKNFTILNNVIYGILPFKITQNFDGTIDTMSSYLLVISENQGKKFYYLDATALKNPLLENLFPDIKFAIKLPQ